MSDHDQILDVLARYARGVDDRDFAAVAALFTADATIDYAIEGGATLGAVELAPWLARALAKFRVTQHLLGLPVIEVAGDTARTRVGVLATHVQTKRDGSETTAVLNGTYRHEWSRTPAGWRIRTLRFESQHAVGSFLPVDELRLHAAPAAS